MSPPELAFRVARYVQVTTEALAWRRRHRVDQEVHQAEGRPGSVQGPAASQTELLRARAQKIPSLYPDIIPRTLKTVAKIKGGEIDVFGHDVRVESPEAWLVDPRTQRRWPSVFWSDVSYRRDRSLEGPLWIWELNRHHHLDPLARAYTLTGDQGAKALILDQLSDWIDANPRETGINWASPLEIAVRLTNWCWAVVLIWEPGDDRDPRWHKIMRSIREQANHVFRHMSAYSSANNHAIGEAAGLAVVGQSFPWMQDAGRWAARGRDVLAVELERQILPDGVPAEQAIAYLAFILDLNLVAWHGFPRVSPPDMWWERLAAAADFMVHVMDERGHIPQIGDSDDATVLGFYDRPGEDRFGPALAAAVSLVQRPEVKRVRREWDELAHWILGAEGKARFDSVQAADWDPGSKAFRSGGYCVMRQPGRMLVFDCGPLGYLSTAAHGHADALSLWVHVDGEPLLVDSGTYAYQEGGPWRTYFRSTRAHNTVVVDGMDQSEQQGDFLWGSKANTRLLRWDSQAQYDMVIAEHDGYHSLGVGHRRSVLFAKPNWLLVVDDLLGTGQHLIEQLWHLPSGAVLVREQLGCAIGVGGVRAHMIPVQVDGLTLDILQGQVQPIQGWISSSYGFKEPAPVIGLRGTLTLPTRVAVAYALRPWEGDAGGEPASLLALFEHLNEEANQP